LNIQGSVRRARELSQDTVAGSINHAAAVFSDHWQYDGLVRFDIADGGFLVGAHQSAVARYVGSEYGRQFAGSLLISKDTCQIAPDRARRPIRPRPG